MKKEAQVRIAPAEELKNLVFKKIA